jgi:hypothetical protein
VAWCRDGLGHPPAVEVEAAAELRGARAVVERFVAACCERAPDAVVEARTLAAAFAAWAAAAGERALRELVLFRTLGDLGFDSALERRGGQVVRVRCGLRLRPDAPGAASAE